VSDQEPGIGYRFETADARQYLARRWTTRFSGVQALIAQRVDPAAGIAPGWRARIGCCSCTARASIRSTPPGKAPGPGCCC
jgi:hypothetical protein